MLPRHKNAAGLASMLTSDSEPDFDDIDIIRVASARDNKNNRMTSKSARARGGNSPNRVSKPMQRTRAAVGSRSDSNLSAPSRRPLLDKSNTSSLLGQKRAKKEVYDSGDAGIGNPSNQPFEHNEVENRKRMNGTQSTRHKEYNSGEENLRHRQLEWTEVYEGVKGDQEMAGDDRQMRHPDALVAARTLDIDTDEGSARRRLGELTKKYEVLEARHKDLQEIGVKAAERNFDRLKRQADETAKASDELIKQLRDQLATQLALAKQGEETRQQLVRTEGHSAELEKRIANLNESLTHARAEIKSLSARLSVSRAAETNISVPGSALKPGSAGSKSNLPDVVLAAQVKEDLYADLTGLIVRGMSRSNGEDVFDCIQTGRNGTLHFKLALGNGDGSENYAGVQFTYLPQLDESRDKDLMRILPEYMVDELVFPGAQAAKFYSRVNRSLTERIIED